MTSPETATLDRAPPRPVTLVQALPVWLRVAALSFGGPAGQIAVMHRVLVEEKRWISENRFLHALNFCTLLPGPEAQQLATYVGWLMHGPRGGLLAGGLFVLPGLLAIMASAGSTCSTGRPGRWPGCSSAQGRGARHRARGGAAHRPAGPARPGDDRARRCRLFGHLRPRRAVPAHRRGGGPRRLPRRPGRASGLPPGGGHAAGAAGGAYLFGDDALPRERTTWGETLTTFAVWAAIWLVPVAALLLALGPDDVFSRIAVSSPRWRW